jgi:hypothetical protein
MVQQPPVGQTLLIVEASRSHSDTPHSVGLLWTSDQPDAETSTWQHTTLTGDRHPCFRRDSNPQSQRAATDLCLRPLGSAVPFIWVRILHISFAIIAKTILKSLFAIKSTFQMRQKPKTSARGKWIVFNNSWRYIQIFSPWWIAGYV